MDITIRKAEGFDIAQLSQLLLEWLEETDLNYPGLCPYSHVWLANYIYANYCIVAVQGDKIVGTIGMHYGHFPWNNENHVLFCDFLIVNKEHRKSKAALKIMNAVKDFSNETSLPIFMGIMTGNLAKEKDRFLEICGFKYAGGNFVYGV